MSLLTGCGTPKEKTAPCKRPANLLSYASEPDAQSPFPVPTEECGPMRPVNTGPVNTGPVNADPNTADEAIEQLSAD
jgi:hypothetical protein